MAKISAMRMDEFTPKRVVRRGRKFDCIEHYQWFAVFYALEFDPQYRPCDFRIEYPGTERYKLGQNTRTVYYSPAFFIPKLGYVDFTESAPTSSTLSCAERMSHHKDEPVFIIQGAVIVPAPWKEITNPVWKCMGDVKPKSGLRMQHDGRRFKFGPPTYPQDIYAPPIISACEHAKQLQ